MTDSQKLKKSIDKFEDEFWKIEAINDPNHLLNELTKSWFIHQLEIANIFSLNSEQKNSLSDIDALKIKTNESIQKEIEKKGNVWDAIDKIKPMIIDYFLLSRQVLLKNTPENKSNYQPLLTSLTKTTKNFLNIIDEVDERVLNEVEAALEMQEIWDDYVDNQNILRKSLKNDEVFGGTEWRVNDADVEISEMIEIFNEQIKESTLDFNDIVKSIKDHLEEEAERIKTAIKQENKKTNSLSLKKT